MGGIRVTNPSQYVAWAAETWALFTHVLCRQTSNP